jgi:pimeloyl-ACP methyl ester carboxylesterase
VAEQVVQIPTRDGKTLYGRLREVAGAPLVLLVHGLTGSMNEHLHYNAARALEAAGLSTLRFNLYGDEPNTRRLVASTLAQHACDVDDALVYAREHIASPKTVVVGHSLGGLTALCTTQPFDYLVLWDPSHSSHFIFMKSVTDLPGLPTLKRLESGVDHLMSAEMVEELAATNSDELIARWKTPTLLIYCDAPDRPESANQYREHATAPFEMVLIPNSDHIFSLGESGAHLSEITAEWIKGRIVP